MARTVRKERLKKMYEAILRLQTEEECEEFFEDLCSSTELSAMEQRFAVADLLIKNEVYLTIMDRTRASTATISRVNRMLNDGTGVLPDIISAMNAEEDARTKDLP